MNKNVILFLTSPNNASRIQMCLDNFKQLEKTGYDIITLTTTDLLPQYIYDKSKMVIHDYNEHKCEKKTYRDFFKNTGFGYFFSHYTQNSEVVMFHDTHFPSLIRNFKTLVNYSNSMKYENYFYIEDDHFIHDSDLTVINQYFEKLNENDMILFSFKRYTDSNLETVYCSYFHFGNLNKVSRLIENFAYTAQEFKTKNPYVYLQFYEAMFTALINENRYPEIKIHDEFFESGVNVFPNSKINQIYSFKGILDGSRCNLIYDGNHNKTTFFYTSVGLSEKVNIKLYVKNVLRVLYELPPGCWYALPINDDDVNHLCVVINDKFKKCYENQMIECIPHNGEIIPFKSI